uniref:Uncharacterized protein n=1 Tax=Tricholoma terreum TaxID=76328 RepID=A0A6C0W3N6_9AGAR|nr:hypothetical protein [Tricholoma terreum]QIC20227.1 hypothetical protein [Tricholoma terreum]
MKKFTLLYFNLISKRMKSFSNTLFYKLIPYQIKSKLNQQLIIFYKSRCIFNGFNLKNKYILLTIFILIIITIFFNKNIGYFKDINICDFNIFTIIVYFVLLYFTYIKFNIMIRIISLIKSIHFFYVTMKQENIKDIKLIALYYYFFNLLLIFISILFVNNIYYNLYYININNYIEYSNIISILLVLLYLKPILTTEFKIIETKIKPLFILLNIFILFIPFIIFNLYSEKITVFLENYCIKNFVIYCETTGDDNFRTKLTDDKSLVISNKNNNFSMGNHQTNVNFSSDVDHLKVATSSKVLLNSEGIMKPINTDNRDIVEIYELEQINDQIIKCFIFDFVLDPRLVFNDAYLNETVNHKDHIFKLDTHLIVFLNEYMNILAKFNNTNKDLMDLIFNLYDLDLDHKSNLAELESNYIKEQTELENLRDKKNISNSNLLNEVDTIGENEFKQLTKDLTSKYSADLEALEKTKQSNISTETIKFQNTSSRLERLLQKTLPFLKFTETPTEEDFKMYDSLFTKKNKSSISIKSVDSDETIKAVRRN